MSTLIDALNAATAADLQEIDAELDQLRKHVAGLEALRKVVDRRLNGPPSKAPAAPKGADGPKGAAWTERQEAAARLIADRGPRAQMQISEALGIPIGSMHRVLRADWFEREGGKVTLTHVGRQAVTGG